MRFYARYRRKYVIFEAEDQPEAHDRMLEELNEAHDTLDLGEYHRNDIELRRLRDGDRVELYTDVDVEIEDSPNDWNTSITIDDPDTYEEPLFESDHGDETVVFGAAVRVTSGVMELEDVDVQLWTFEQQDVDERCFTAQIASDIRNL